MSSGLDQAVAEDASRMALQVKISDIGPCRKKISVTVPEADIAAIRNDALDELADRAQVPGFRVGRVPRALLEKRFKEEISSDIKQKVLLASLEQISDEHKIEPISEPKIDVGTLEIPDAGDFSYEFEVEVRPDFDLPDYAGIKIQRSVGEPSDEELESYRQMFLESYAERLTTDEPAAAGDYVICDLTFSHDGKTIREVTGRVFGCCQRSASRIQFWKVLMR